MSPVFSLIFLIYTSTGITGIKKTLDDRIVLLLFPQSIYCYCKIVLDLMVLCYFCVDEKWCLYHLQQLQYIQIQVLHSYLKKFPLL